MEYEIAYLIHTRRTPAPLPKEQARSHDITFVHDGIFEYEINGECFTVHSGEALYCPLDGIKRRFKSGEVYYTSLNIMTEPKAIFPLPFRCVNADTPELRFYLKRLLQIYQNGGGYCLEKCSAMISLIVSTLAELNPPDSQTADNPYVSEVKAAILADPSKRRNISELAERVHLTPSYLSTLFKRVCGISISEYALDCQLKLAGKLLSEGESVSSAAEKSGFCDVYYFSRAFSREIGITPSEYRAASLYGGSLGEDKIETPEKSKPTITQIIR